MTFGTDFLDKFECSPYLILACLYLEYSVIFVSIMFENILIEPHDQL